MTRIIKYLCILFCIAVAHQATAQDRMQFWGDYYQYRMLTNNKWKMSNRMGLRYHPDNNYTYRITYRPDVARKIKQNGRLMVGSGFFYRLDKDVYNSLEIRPWVGFQRDPSHLNSLALIHIWRWENRFYTGEDYVFESRLRYKVTVNLDIFRREGKALSLIMSPEVFVSLGSFNNINYFRLRTDLGARYQWNSDWQTDFSLTHQRNTDTPIFSGEDFQWILQLKVKRLLYRN